MSSQSDPFATGFVGYVAHNAAAVVDRDKREAEHEARLRELLPPETRARAEAALRPDEPTTPKHPQPTVQPKRITRVRFERSTTPKPAKPGKVTRGATQSFVQLDPAKLAALPVGEYLKAADQIVAALTEANRRRGY